MFTKWLFVPLAVLAGLYLLRVLLVFHNLLRIRLQRPTRETVPDDEVPASFRDGIAEPVQELQKLGFAFNSSTRAQPMVRLTDDQPFTCWMRHAQSGALAAVAFAPLPEPVAPWTVAFYSALSDGRAVLTTNGLAHTMHPDLGRVVHNDPYVATVEQQFRSHLAAVAAAGASPEKSAAADVTSVLPFDGLDAALTAGLVRALSDDTFEYTLSGALRLAFRVVGGTKRAQRRLQARLAAMKAGGQTNLRLPPVDEEVRAWRRQVALTSLPARRKFLWALFAVTVCLFGAFAASHSGARYGLLLLAVLLFHEGGHWLAMRVRGYSNTSIFFIPFVGGLASGSKHDATLTDELIVLLAGPLPGLLLALALTVTGNAQGRWLHPLVWVLVFLNLFNLLPALPLDGGRIVQALFSARSSTLDMFSRIAGIALMLLLAAATSSVLMLGIAVFQLLVLPQGYRLAQLRKEFAQRMSETHASWNDAPRVFFSLAREGGGARLSFAKRLGLARAVLLQPACNTAPRRPAVAGWFAAYAGSIAVGSFALMTATGPSTPKGEPVSYRPQLREVATLTCPATWAPVAQPAASVREIDREMPLGLAVFDHPVADDEIAALDGIPDARLRWKYGPLLLAFQSGEDWREQMVEESGVAHPASSAPRKATDGDRLAAAVRARGGQWFTPKQGDVWPWLSCRTETEAAAAQLATDLREFGTIQPFIPGLRPPWRAAPDSSPETKALEARVRHTVLVARQGRIFEQGKFGVAGALLRKIFSPSSGRDLYGQMRQNLQAALDQERKKGLIDEETAHALEEDPFMRRKQTKAAIAARAGAIKNAAPSEGLVGAFWVSQRATEVSFRLGNTRREVLESDFPHVLGWLCARQCRDPRVSLEPPRARFAQADDD